MKLMDRDLKDFRRELQQAHFIIAVLIFVAAVALISAAILGAL